MRSRRQGHMPRSGPKGPMMYLSARKHIWCPLIVQFAQKFRDFEGNFCATFFEKKLDRGWILWYNRRDPWVAPRWFLDAGIKKQAFPPV